MEFVIFSEKENAKRKNEKRYLIEERRLLRNKQSWHSINDQRFIELFRLDKKTTQQLIDVLSPHLRKPKTLAGISPELKIIAALRFYATGDYQRGVGQDFCLGLSQTMMSRIIDEVTETANVYLVPKCVKFPTSIEQKATIKQKFMEKTNFHGILDAVDGTHIFILTPEKEEWNFVNRKGVHSINAQIICDFDLNILGINAKFPGATHDAAIWSSSAVRVELEKHYREGDTTSWLLGDSGYPIEPWLMVPYSNPATHAEQRFNTAHMSARNCVERCIGVMKMRFRCLMRERVLRYDPLKTSKIINVCAALHNMCVKNNILVNTAEPEALHEYEEIIDADGGVQARAEIQNELAIFGSCLVEGRRVRENIVQTHFV